VTHRISQNIADGIGNTPLVKLNALSPKGGATIYAKIESLNPGGSVKDRVCLHMIDEAERSGRLAPGATIVEPTSGNTGIGLALIGAVRKYSVILVLPETMSTERASLLASYGAQLVLTAARDGMQGSIKEAAAIAAQHPSCFMPDQFSNPANPAMHRLTTAPAIWEALEGSVDAFVAAVGTGGTITGCGEFFKDQNPNIAIVAVEPASSPVLSGGVPGPHKIQGIGAGFVPTILNRKLLDRIVTVTDGDAYQTSKLLAKKEGLLAGISSGANVWAAQQVAQELGPGKRVVTVLCDTGERYMSMEKYFSI